MGYRGRYKRRYTARSPGQERALEHVRAYRDLERRLGPIVDDVRNAFFNLNKNDLNDLFSEYSNEYGSSAEDYARKTFYEWKTATRRMSGQTAERLINLVPRYLSYEQRYNIIKKLCDHHSRKLYRSVEIFSDDISTGINLFRKTIAEFWNFYPLKEIPDHVMQTVTWLNDDDITAARALLAQIDDKTAQMVKVMATKEIEKIESLVRQGLLSTASHEINFPNGTLSLVIKEPPFGILGKIFRGIFR